MSARHRIAAHLPAMQNSSITLLDRANMPSIFSRTRTTLEMIKWEHSIFALPFALTAALLAANGLPPWRTLAWILVAMVSARSCAMAFNRWADADLDAANPRTSNRAIPAGLLSRQFVLGFTIVMALVFVAAAAALNRLTLYLSPVVLAVLLGYSYMKRLTRWSHLVLGLALGLAPSAAWIAVRGSLDPRILVLTAAVTLVGGRIRCPLRLPGLRTRPRGGALQPAPRHRNSQSLLGRAHHAPRHAGPARLVRPAVSLSTCSAGSASPPSALLLAYEHSIVSPRDLRRLNAAFFTMNGVIAMVFLAFVAADLWLRS